jgi:exopolysaccharide biosynthesis predicted pyruvyltransferase EpsI
MNSNNNLDLAVLLHSLPKPIHFIGNPGNAGDSLITCATHQFFRKHEIDCKIWVDVKTVPIDGTIVYAGGGNFGGTNSRAAAYIQRFAFTCDNFVLLPHTLFGAEELLASLPANVHIICRERVSFEHAKAHCVEAKVYLHDDMVINADVREFLLKPERNTILISFVQELLRRVKGQAQFDFGISLRCVLRYQFYSLQRLISADKTLEPGILNAFRTDVEKTDIALPTDNIDLSDLYELSSCDTELAFLATYRLLKHIDEFHTVRTNRLHVAIAAIKLGKTVYLFGNNYFKIRAIYEYSIKDRFDNVVWHD